jgi:pectate lyase
VQLTATVRDAAGNTLAGKTITWSSSNSSLATVDTAGLVRGVAAGSATISATSEGVSGSAAVTVTEPSVASVTVSPSSAAVAVGSTVQLTATVKDAAGNTLAGKTVTWSSSNSSVATVDTAGLVRGVATGSATITATSDGVSGAAEITVTDGGPTTCDPLPGVLPVFPGAEGYGTTTPAGRCGQVIRVTNLNDAGPGSLRAALLTPGPRQVIFEVSGQINLNSRIEIGDVGDPDTYANLSVYGQTAPSPGITIAGAQIAIRSHDVLIQHLRFRHGGLAEPVLTRTLIVLGPISRVVVDHVSTSWATDDNTGIWAGPSDVTISNSISSESHKGTLIGQGSQRISIIRNLYAHIYNRVPMANAGANIVVVNNYLYNTGFPCCDSPFQIGNAPAGWGPSLASVIGNVAKDGASNDGATGLFIDTNVPGSKLYFHENALTRDPQINDRTTNTEFVSSPPYPLPPLTTVPSGDLEARIAATVGARPADRDAVDTRIINDMVNGTGRHIKLYQWGNEDESVVGGFPPLAQNRRTLTVPPNPHGDDDGDGYTNLEEWIHQFTAQVEGRN